jgi:poly [ADP-ribose] polymerase
VLVHNNKVYSATLNQTNISNNNNKYYNLQIIQSDKNPNINYFMTRWGRVGTPGQKSIVGPVSINVAITEYNSKFY